LVGKRPIVGKDWWRRVNICERRNGTRKEDLTAEACYPKPKIRGG
jgi:hypothetical protein